MKENKDSKNRINLSDNSKKSTNPIHTIASILKTLFEDEKVTKKNLTQPKSVPFKELYTENILKGDTKFIETLIKNQSKENLEILKNLFDDNLILSHWLVEDAPSLIRKQMPKMILDLVDEQLQDEYYNNC